MTASVTIQIYPTPTLSYLPGDPRPGEPITFTANSFFSTNLIRWDFGDGTVEDDTSPPTILHTYNRTGTYQVRAFDNGEITATASIIIYVRPPHLIVYSPKQPLLGMPVTFQAINFSSPSIQWDFGDGTPLQQAGPAITHVYQNEGSYKLVATDERDNFPFPVTSQIRIYPIAGPTAPFGISYINLRFVDGLSYKVVSKDFSQLIAYADIKYEGTGILVAQWLVDGQPFRMVSETLAYAEDFTFDSGSLPGLPTLSPGIHEVTLNIIQPQTDFSIPVIQYFVSIQAKETVQKWGEIDLTIAGARGLDDEVITVSPDTITAPLNTPFLLQGTVRNESPSKVFNILLRVYIDDLMTDQKLLREVEIGEERPFETSLSIPSEETKKIYIRLFETNGKTPSLIYQREWNILYQNIDQNSPSHIRGNMENEGPF